ncbi:MAG: Holliday junction branch migration protein RuvA [SAR202 cluster bacterium Io17-Chloro-G9]|nr:MAG: Holliday junction branch migration protein RuvA [SAR202 cluster bacterium Io17-Chloro-G9]
MIVSVRGTLEAVGSDWVHLLVGGVTLQVYVPAAAIGELGSIGNQVRLFTHLRIREEQPTLYGFLSAASLNLFLLLNGVSGVGPRLALALISSLGAARLQQAIATGDVGALNDAPGVGRRTAGRVILELKGKLELEPDEMPAAAGDMSEVIAALTALGYSTVEARRAVANLDDSQDLTMEDRVRMALQQMAGGG